MPYGIALLAAIAIRDGHAVQVFDANAWRTSDAVVAQVLQADRWDVIGMGGITTAYRSIKHITAMAKELAPQALLVVGGGFLTSMPNDIMRFLPHVDLGVVGEGFISFPEVLRRVDAGNRDWAAVKGLIWREPSGRARLNPEQPLLEDLDSLPYPAGSSSAGRGLLQEQHGPVLGGGHGGPAPARHQRELRRSPDLPVTASTWGSRAK